MNNNYTEAPRVPVIGADDIPLMACHPGTAQKLVERGKAKPLRIGGIYCIRMRTRLGKSSDVKDMDLNITSGHNSTNMAVTIDSARGHRRVIECLQIMHKSSDCNTIRSQKKRSRRERVAKMKMRDRKGVVTDDSRLAPLTIAQRNRIVEWAELMQQMYPLGSVRVKSHRLNTEMMVNPKTGVIEYDPRNFRGWQVRAYIYERDWHRCAYCDNDTRQLQIDHIVPQSLNGSNGIENLVLCCSVCNQRKADSSLEDFLSSDIERLERIYFRTAQEVRTSKRYLNQMMPSLVKHLSGLGMPVSEWDSATTSWNRKQLGVKFNHCYDATLLGTRIKSITGIPNKVLRVCDNERRPRRVDALR